MTTSPQSSLAIKKELTKSQREAVKINLQHIDCLVLLSRMRNDNARLFLKLAQDFSPKIDWLVIPLAVLTIPLLIALL